MMSAAAERRPSAWRYSISWVTTFDCFFEEDVELYAKAGCSASAFGDSKWRQIGWKGAKDLLLRSGLRATNCIPEVNSIMPYALSPTPDDRTQRDRGVPSQPWAYGKLKSRDNRHDYRAARPALLERSHGSLPERVPAGWKGGETPWGNDCFGTNSYDRGRGL